MLISLLSKDVNTSSEVIGLTSMVKEKPRVNIIANIRVSLFSSLVKEFDLFFKYSPKM